MWVCNLMNTRDYRGSDRTKMVSESRKDPIEGPRVLRQSQVYCSKKYLSLKRKVGVP